MLWESQEAMPEGPDVPKTRPYFPLLRLPPEIVYLVFLQVPRIGDLCALRDTSATLRTFGRPALFKSIHVQGTAREGMALRTILRTPALVSAVQIVSFDYNEGSHLEEKEVCDNEWRYFKGDTDHDTFTSIFCSALSQLHQAVNMHSLTLSFHEGDLCTSEEAAATVEDALYHCTLRER